MSDKEWAKGTHWADKNKPRIFCKHVSKPRPDGTGIMYCHVDVDDGRRFHVEFHCCEACARRGVEAFEEESARRMEKDTRWFMRRRLGSIR